MQIHPDVDELVDTKAGDVIHSETVRFQVLSGDVEVAFKRSNTPAEGAIRQQGTCVFMSDAQSLH